MNNTLTKPIRTEKHIRCAIDETVTEIQRLEKRRVSHRDRLSRKEREELRLRVLELHDKYCKLTEELEIFY